MKKLFPLFIALVIVLSACSLRPEPRGHFLVDRDYGSYNLPMDPNKDVQTQSNPVSDETNSLFLANIHPIAIATDGSAVYAMKMVEGKYEQIIVVKFGNGTETKSMILIPESFRPLNYGCYCWIEAISNGKLYFYISVESYSGSVISVYDATNDFAEVGKIIIPFLNNFSGESSFDGSQLISTTTNNITDFYLVKIGQQPEKLNFDGKIIFNPQFSPDGTKFLYQEWTDNGPDNQTYCLRIYHLTGHLAGRSGDPIMCANVDGSNIHRNIGGYMSPDWQTLVINYTETEYVPPTNEHGIQYNVIKSVLYICKPDGQDFNCQEKPAVPNMKYFNNFVWSFDSRWFLIGTENATGFGYYLIRADGSEIRTNSLFDYVSTGQDYRIYAWVR